MTEKEGLGVSGPSSVRAEATVGQSGPEGGGAIQTDAQVDARGLRCPLPLLKAKQALRDLAPGQRLQVLATDSGSVRDFQSFAELSGHQLEHQAEEAGVYCHILLKS